jgi:DNA topoisomerase-1
MSSTDEDIPLKRLIKPDPLASPAAIAKKSRILEDSDEDMPLRPAIPRSSRNASLSSSPSIAKVESESPQKKKKSKKVKSPKTPTKVKSPKTPTKVKKETPTKVKKETPTKKSPKKEEEEEEYKWWLEENRDDTIKWNSLVHNGVLFPPNYEPHGVRIKYKGQEVELSPNAEEVASFYAALIGTDWVQNEVFQRNFFNDFLQVCLL